MNEPMPRNPKRLRRDVMIAAGCGVFVAAMVGAAYAAVPPNPVARQNML